MTMAAVYFYAMESCIITVADLDSAICRAGHEACLCGILGKAGDLCAAMTTVELLHLLPRVNHPHHHGPSLTDTHHLQAGNQQ